MRDIAPEEVASLAAGAAAGLDELWVIEDLNWAGGISQLSTVLEATDNDQAGRPLIGHGIAPAPFRNPAALAMEWATLARMHPGRVIGGIGHGVPGWMRQVSPHVESPLTLLRETIESTIEILAGGRVNYAGDYVDIVDVELVFPPKERVPVVAGVTGPKSLRLSGEVADGTVIAEGFSPDRLVEARSLIDEGRSEAGRTDAHHVSVFTAFYCGDLNLLPPPPTDVSEGFAAVGADAASVAAQLQAIVDTGLDSLIILPLGPDLEQIRRFADDVVPLLDL